MGVELKRERDGKTMHALLPIPSQLARFIKLPPAETAPNGAAAPVRYIRIESAIGMFVTKLFPGFIARSQGAFRVLRDSDIEVAGGGRGSRRAPMRPRSSAVAAAM